MGGWVRINLNVVRIVKSAQNNGRSLRGALLKNHDIATLKDICQTKIYQEVFKNPQGLEKLNQLSDEQLPRELKNWLLFSAVLDSQKFWKIFCSPEDSSENIDLPAKKKKSQDSSDLDWRRTSTLLLSNNDLNNTDNCLAFEFVHSKNVQCYTAYQCQEIVTAHVKCNDTLYHVIAIHIIASHLEKSPSIDHCADDIYQLVVHTSKSFPDAKILISQALPIINDESRNQSIASTNALVKSKLSDLPNATYVEFNFGKKKVNAKYFQSGGRSLSDAGMQRVRDTLEKTIMRVLDLK